MTTGYLLILSLLRKVFAPKFPLTFTVSTGTDVYSQLKPKRGLLIC